MASRSLSISCGQVSVSPAGAPFEPEYLAHSIEHNLIKPDRPQIKGMVGRFNGRISDVLATRRYTSGDDLKQTLK